MQKLRRHIPIQKQRPTHMQNMQKTTKMTFNTALNQAIKKCDNSQGKGLRANFISFRKNELVLQGDNINDALKQAGEEYNKHEEDTK